MCLFLEIQSDPPNEREVRVLFMLTEWGRYLRSAPSLPGHELREAAKINLEQGRKFADEGVSEGRKKWKICDICAPNLERRNRIVKGVEKKTF